ncbi:hypothetical protein CAI16_01710 [Virgibacillus dokdonensis]|uniref:Uncharacterized protein n=1 Tax=Virgibacillus dokdonensis TaxID=302167 RepID=A0A3E0WW50_9BACI|nr:hypothetical protein [Virgibacillus dokdonensis]RFA37220.1 hypothetical protein CAI16_01710 [Virgibacillus dokdonensis]
MNTEHNPTRDQAKQLRRKVQEINETDSNTMEQVPDSKQEKDIDVLNLPPRKETHQQKKQTIRLRISNPTQRFLFIVFFILLIIVGAYFIIGDKLFTTISFYSFDFEVL